MFLRDAAAGAFTPPRPAGRLPDSGPVAPVAQARVLTWFRCRRKLGPGQLTKRLIVWEIVIVFALSLGGSALFAIIDLIASLTANKSLNKQQALIVGSLAPGRPLLDLVLQLANLLIGLAPVALVCYLLVREGTTPSAAIGLDAREPGRDLAKGAVLAAVIGGSGLAPLHRRVQARPGPERGSGEPARRLVAHPRAILQAARDGILEEILVLGYLLRRLGQLGLSPAWAIAISAVVRGSYHLYQGFGGFLGNAVMGVIFALLYLRWKRVTPFIIAHGLIDTGAFVGYAVLHGHVSWLP